MLDFWFEFDWAGCFGSGCFHVGFISVEVVEYGKSCVLINVCGLVFNSETVVCGSYFGSVLLRRNANCARVRCRLVLMKDVGFTDPSGASSGDNSISWVVVAMAASSLFVMIALLQVDRIVEGDMYSYGLQFSSAWAGPYSSMIRLAFVLGWFNIVAAVGVHLYSITFRRKEVEHLVAATQEEIARRRAEALRKPPVEPPILPGVPDEEFGSRKPWEPEREEELTAPACS